MRTSRRVPRRSSMRVTSLLTAEGVSFSKRAGGRKAPGLGGRDEDIHFTGAIVHGSSPYELISQSFIHSCMDYHSSGFNRIFPLIDSHARPGSPMCRCQHVRHPTGDKGASMPLALFALTDRGLRDRHHGIRDRRPVADRRLRSSASPCRSPASSSPIYALGVTFGAPVLTALTGKLEPQTAAAWFDGAVHRRQCHRRPVSRVL